MLPSPTAHEGDSFMRNAETPTPSATGNAPATQQTGEVPAPIEPVTGSPVLDQPATYVPKNNIVEIDLSEYAGYGGLIVANGGLAPNPDSFFAKQYGFQVKLSVSEEETWGKLNNGHFAASATTADVLAVLGRQFDVTVPVQIGFSRGADMRRYLRGWCCRCCESSDIYGPVIWWTSWGYRHRMKFI